MGRAYLSGPDQPNPASALSAYENGDVNLPEKLEAWRGDWLKTAAATRP